MLSMIFFSIVCQHTSTFITEELMARKLSITIRLVKFYFITIQIIFCVLYIVFNNEKQTWMYAITEESRVCVMYQSSPKLIFLQFKDVQHNLSGGIPHYELTNSCFPLLRRDAVVMGMPTFVNCYSSLFPGDSMVVHNPYCNCCNTCTSQGRQHEN